MAIITRGQFSPTILTSGSGIGNEVALNEISATANATWPVNNLALYLTFSLFDDITVIGLGHFQGIAASGNYDIGIYDKGGTRLVSLGSTAVGSTNTNKVVSVTPILLPKGFYLFGYSFSSTTNQVSRFNPAAGLLAAWGQREESNAVPLPATATFVINSRAYFPPFVFLKTAQAVTA
jgi:hypothetical protein